VILHQPGVTRLYSVAMYVLGAVMERPADQSLPDIIAARITRPLEMRDTSFTMADMTRLAVPYADATTKRVPFGSLSLACRERRRCR
jgi:CubicO group peptidase (beta-lactamase class C family)